MVISISDTREPCPGGKGGYSRFQVSGMVEGFFGFEFFDSGIFLAGKFGKYMFEWLDLSRDFLGVFKTI